MMRHHIGALALALLAFPLAAQDGGFLPDGSFIPDEQLLTPSDEGVLTLEELQSLPRGSERELRDIITQTQETVAKAGGAEVRALDKITGIVSDISVDVGETARFGRIDITLGECRYPENNPAGEAYVYLVIRLTGQEEPAFSGWMLASSPALNALDHARYDVWALRCTTS